jgi:hypothetical protein
MSFLSRKPARPSGRGRDDEYDDLDGYAHDGYQTEDDGWSPGDYFSPEGIKGRWAGEHPEGRSGGHGRREDARDGSGPGRDGSGPGYDSYRDDFSGADYANPPGNPPGYGPDEFASGAYDLPEGADERVDRARRRRRDREDRGERTGILRLRRDRGEDIWPDDGISDEDYWASVAADRPLTGTDAPQDTPPGRPGAGSPGRPGADSRPRTDARPSAGGPDPRFDGPRPGGQRDGGQRDGGQRSGGRLGPPPGLAEDHKPTPAVNSAAAPGGGRPGSSRPPSSGPMTARPATGPQPTRGATGPVPSVGVTSSRPPAVPQGMRPGQGRNASGPNRLGQPNAQPSFQPSGGYPAVSPRNAGGGQPGRPQDRGNWGERTERIDRVNASGYPDPRPAGRAPGTDPAGRAPGYRPSSSGPQGAARGTGRHSSASWQASERQSAERQSPERRDVERRDVDRREPERRAPERREYSQGGSREQSGTWPAPDRGTRSRGVSDDDPLTSKAYSRSANTETDGRSYRAAASRSQAQPKLTDPTPPASTSSPGSARRRTTGSTGMMRPPP